MPRRPTPEVRAAIVRRGLALVRRGHSLESAARRLSPEVGWSVSTIRDWLRDALGATSPSKRPGGSGRTSATSRFRQPTPDEQPRLAPSRTPAERAARLASARALLAELQARRPAPAPPASPEARPAPASPTPATSTPETAPERLQPQALRLPEAAPHGRCAACREPLPPDRPSPAYRTCSARCAERAHPDAPTAGPSWSI